MWLGILQRGCNFSGLGSESDDQILQRGLSLAGCYTSAGKSPASALLVGVLFVLVPSGRRNPGSQAGKSFAYPHPSLR